MNDKNYIERIEELESDMFLIVRYLNIRDKIAAQYPRTTIVNWIVAFIDDDRLFNGTMTELYERICDNCGCLIYKGVPPLGRALKVLKPKLAKMGYVVTDTDRKSREFQIYLSK